jgi:hypothetical protein
MNAAIGAGATLSLMPRCSHEPLEPAPGLYVLQ